MNLLNTILQHGSVIISISQLGNWDPDTINNLPKVAQAVYKRVKKNKYVSETQVRVLIDGPFLLAGETSWRRLVTPG